MHSRSCLCSLIWEDSCLAFNGLIAGLSLLTSNAARLTWPLPWHQKFLAPRFLEHGEFSKTLMGAAYKRLHPGLQSTCLLSSKTDTWYRIKAPAVDAWTTVPFSALTWPPFLFYVLRFFVSFLPALRCDFLPHLSPDGWALYPQHSTDRQLFLFLAY